MRLIPGLAIYRLLLPVLFVVAFPGWVVKMLRRGGFRTRLGERASIYTKPREADGSGAVHVHAVSVGETLLALKLIREWRLSEPELRFVIATGTATGHAVASSAGVANLRVTYAPLDFVWMVRRYLSRFRPSQIVLIEGDVWPHLLLHAHRRKVPISLVNARVSPRSARRYQKFAAWVRPIFRLLDAVALQETADAGLWEELGVSPSKIHITGSLKFDPASGHRPTARGEFQYMLDCFGKSRPVVLAASTHPGEEVLLAEAIRKAVPHALPVIVPRHAERRDEVKSVLQRSGFEVVLRSTFAPPSDPPRGCFVIDSTGELSDWTAHADAVIIGKSFLSSGGQNPTEAILARKPVIFGPHMENFQPLADHLVSGEGALQVRDADALPAAIQSALNPSEADALSHRATRALDRHEGATRRTIALLAAENGRSN